VAVARDLGFKRVLVPRLSSILSAYGMALADIEIEFQEPESVIFNEASSPRITQRIELLKTKALAKLTSQGFQESQVTHNSFLNMRYVGSDTALMVQKSDADEDFGDAFTKRHLREFGLTQSREILVDDVRVRSVGNGIGIQTPNLF
jgi:5-oxoprolinase (ATP-hydrolysing)